MSAAGETPASEVVLSLQGISKQYGAVQALADVSLDCRAGEIHAVVGENGSGKSTLLGIASGFVDPDHGSVVIGDARCGEICRRQRSIWDWGWRIRKSRSSCQRRSSRIYTSPPGKKRRPSYGGMKDQDILARYELDDLFADAPVAWLTVGERQQLEVVKALLAEPKVLLLDEPTTALGPSQVEWLHRTIVECAGRGIGVVYVSHRLPDVLQVADRITVLRDGKSQGTYDAAGMAEPALVALMIGRSLDAAFPHRAAKTDDDASVLIVTDLQGKFCGPITLNVNRGEILGLAGKSRATVRVISSPACRGASRPRAASCCATASTPT
ncbi:MAG: ATP-binding cassette domain-containing protein [Anaerolineae bacterium]